MEATATPTRRTPRPAAKATHARADERLEARVTAAQKQQLQKAADLSGARSLTDFIVSSAEAEARRVLQEHDVIRLSREGQIAFVQALLNPSRPNDKLRRAATNYRDRIGL